MGLFAAPVRFIPDADAKADTSLAFLSAASSIQANSPLLVGLRTGLCGSITTFASWAVSMAKLVYGGRALSAVFGLVVGSQLSLMSLFIGESCAALCFHRRPAAPRRTIATSGWVHGIFFLFTLVLFGFVVAGAARWVQFRADESYVGRDVW